MFAKVRGRRCYVDPATCTPDVARDYGISVNPSWLNVPGLYYSYGACEDDQSFPQDPLGAGYDGLNSAVSLESYASFTHATCPYTVEPDGCECLGNNDALGDEEKAKHGQDYGKWCAAWEVRSFCMFDFVYLAHSLCAPCPNPLPPAPSLVESELGISRQAELKHVST